MKLTPLQRGLLIAGILFAVLISNRPANAAGLCGNYADFVHSLAKNYDEISQGKGLANELMIIEVFASKDTFTVLATSVTGLTCIIAAGKGWVAAVPTIPGDDT